MGHFGNGSRGHLGNLWFPYTWATLPPRRAEGFYREEFFVLYGCE